MVAKRVLFPRSPATMPVKKRLRRVERIAALRKPEMKMQDFNYVNATLADGALATIVELTAIAEGTGVNERIGNRIKIHRIEVRGTLGAENVDAYIIQGHTTTAPVYANFYAYQGSHLLADDSHTKFTEWRYINGRTFIDRSGLRHRFPIGYTAKYNANLSTSCVDNRLWFVVKNDTGAAVSVEYSLRVWFTDI